MIPGVCNKERRAAGEEEHNLPGWMRLSSPDCADMIHDGIPYEATLGDDAKRAAREEARRLREEREDAERIERAQAAHLRKIARDREREEASEAHRRAMQERRAAKAAELAERKAASDERARREAARKAEESARQKAEAAAKRVEALKPKKKTSVRARAAKASKPAAKVKRVSIFSVAVEAAKARGLLTTTEAERYAGLSASSMDNYLALGIIPVAERIECGARALLFFDRADLDKIKSRVDGVHWLSARDACVALRISRTGLDKAVKAGRIKAEERVGRLEFAASEIQRLMRERGVA